MLKFFILQIIKFYQKVLSPDQGIFAYSARFCRFYPSCSEYAYQVIKKRGLFRGIFLSIKRILKCHPWHPGGVDLP